MTGTHADWLWNTARRDFTPAPPHANELFYSDYSKVDGLFRQQMEFLLAPPKRINWSTRRELFLEVPDEPPSLWTRITNLFRFPI